MDATTQGAIIGPDGATPLAERGARFGAVMLDTLFLLIVVAPGVALLWLRQREVDRLWREERIPFDAEAAWHIMDIAGMSLLIVGLVVLVGVQIYLLTSAGQTLGKRFFGVRIVRNDDESRPGFLHVVVLRYLVLKPIWIIPLLGQLFAITDALYILGEDRAAFTIG